MQHVRDQYDVGVLVGRFQVHELHPGHIDLIQHVLNDHEKVIVFLGLSPLRTTASNPLDFEARKQMLLDAFPELTVVYIEDQSEDDVWSRKLDKQISTLLMPGQSAVLYGGRDGFIEHYQGNYPVQELEHSQEAFYSGTAVRKQIARSRPMDDPAFRAGVVWASQGRFPTAYCTVDVAIENEEQDSFLLGRKPGETLFRFIGGFSDPRSPSLEADARRETQEEAGIAITDPQYVASLIVDDWRYSSEPDCIKTVVFIAKHQSGRPTPGDDIEEVRWFKRDTLKPTDLVHTHRPILEALENAHAK